MKAYAQANGLAVGNFYAAKSAYARDLTRDDRAATTDGPKVTLLPVQRAPAPESLRVSLPNGVRIEVPGIVNGEQWRALLESLGHRG